MAKTRTSTTGRYIKKMRSLTDSVSRRNQKIHAPKSAPKAARKKTA